MKRDFVLMLALVAIGLVCQCMALDSDQQMFDYEEEEDISAAKLTRKLDQGRYMSSPNVAILLAKAENKSTTSINVGPQYNITVRELLNLNLYDSVNMTDCTMNEIEERQSVCNQMARETAVSRYCNSCMEKLIKFCREFPYKKLLEASLSKFDWRPHGDVFKFAQDISAFILKDGNEELSQKDNVESFLQTKDDDYKVRIREHCRSFEKDLKKKLYQFDASPTKGYELLKEVDESMYLVRERCNATETRGRASVYSRSREQYY